MADNKVKDFFSTHLTEKLLALVIGLITFIWLDMRDSVREHTIALAAHSLELQANTLAIDGLRKEFSRMDEIVLDRIDDQESRLRALEKKP